MSNPTGAGFKPNKKGERRGGRKAGTPNRITASLKEDALGAAEDVGMVILKGESWQATGKGGRRAYLRWAAVHQPASFIGLLARFVPAELNRRSNEGPRRGNEPG